MEPQLITRPQGHPLPRASGALMAASCGRRRVAARRTPCAALLAALCLAVASAALPEPFASIYHSTDDIMAEFAALAAGHPDVMTWQPPETSAGGDTLGVATFGAATAPPDAPNVLLVFGEHAREIITSDTALWLARALAGARMRRRRRRAFRV